MSDEVAIDLNAPFRGWVRQGEKFGIEQLFLNPLGPLDVVIKNKAAQACYTLTEFLPGALHPEGTDTAELRPRGGHHLSDGRAQSPGHGASGVVAAVGDHVRRVRVGDRVVTPATPVCGTCYSCLRGEWAACGHKSDIVWAGNHTPAFANLHDGTPVFQDHTGGFAEYSVCHESWVIPVYDSPLSDVELSTLTCVGLSGWDSALIGMPIGIGSSVAVFGAGPLGIAVIQGAKMMGSQPIIAIDRIPHRLKAAADAGADVVLNADELGNGVVDRIRELCGPPTENLAGGGKPSTGFYHGLGADHVIEATGRTLGNPSTGLPNDPTGAAPVSWGVAATRRGGTFVHTGWTAPTSDPEVWDPAPGPFFYYAKQYLSAPPTNVFRDVPRLAKLIQSGHLDAKALCDPIMRFEDADVALRHAYDRDRMLPIITYDA